MAVEDDLLSLLSVDNWFAYTLDLAVPNLKKFIGSRLGMFPIAGGDRPQTDGKRIILRNSINDFEDDNQCEPTDNRNMSLYLSDTLHELLHIREGSFLVDARPYLKKFKNQSLAHAILNILDDGRIEYNGRSWMNQEDIFLLENTNEYYSKKRRFPETLSERVVELFSSQTIMKAYPSKFQPALEEEEKKTLEYKLESDELKKQGIETVADLLKRIDEVANKVYGQPIEAALAAVPKIYELLKQAIPNMEEEFPEKGGNFDSVEAPTHAGKSGKAKEKKGQDDEGGNGSGKKSKKDKNKQQAYVGFRGDVHDFSSAEKKSVDDMLEKFKKKQEDEKSDYDVGSGKGKALGESRVKIITYDHLKRKYIHVAELVKKHYRGNKPGFETELLAYQDVVEELIAHFSRLKPNEMQRVFRQEVPDEINMEALIEVLADPSLRSESNIYDASLINVRDSVTAILIDISGSTQGQLETGKRVIDIEKYSAGLLYKALTDSRVGDTVLMYAFSTAGVTNLYTLTGIPNLGALEPEHANADGVAIRGVCLELNRIQAASKNLIVISDGKPVGTGSGACPVIDTKMAFGEAEALGIRTIYFNVDNRAPDYFKDMTAHCTFAQSINKVAKLPSAAADFVLEHL